MSSSSTRPISTGRSSPTTPSCLKCWTHKLDKALKEQRAQRSISEQVKWILKRLLAGARPDVSAVAHELGLSDRTLQRRIDDDGTTFRKLLLEARQELAREYLNRPDIDVAEVAYLLGYEDSNSFYRAFRTWEGRHPPS